MRVTREAEFAPAKPAPQQRRGSRGHDHQRNNLLPIHKEKDNLETTARNGEFLPRAPQKGPEHSTTELKFLVSSARCDKESLPCLTNGLRDLTWMAPAWEALVSSPPPRHHEPFRRCPAFVGTRTAATIRRARAGRLQQRRHPDTSAHAGSFRDLFPASETRWSHCRPHLEPAFKPDPRDGEYDETVSMPDHQYPVAGPIQPGAPLRTGPL